MIIWLHRALIWKGSGRENFCAPLFATSGATALCYLLFYCHSALIKTEVVILTSFVAHWSAPEAGWRNVWSLLGAAKFCGVAKLRPHWRCDLIDKFCQSLRLIKTDLSLVRIGPSCTTHGKVKTKNGPICFRTAMRYFIDRQPLMYHSCRT